MSVSKITIGRRDRIDLPELGYKNIRAKIDTGAYGSVIHCSQIKVIRKDDKNVLSFIMLDPSHLKFRNKKCYFEQFKDKIVKSSSGEREHRYLIVTETVIFGKKIPTEFSLTDRSQMKSPILLGRKFLRQRFIVDVNLRDLSYKLKLKSIK